MTPILRGEYFIIFYEIMDAEVRKLIIVDSKHIIYVEEYLHGEIHKLKLHITKIQPNSRIEYKTFLGTKGIFIIEPRETGTLFTAELHMGTKIPLLGKLVDRIMRMFLSRHLEGLQQHMAEEGQNLKRILEQAIQ